MVYLCIYHRMGIEIFNLLEVCTIPLCTIPSFPCKQKPHCDYHTTALICESITNNIITSTLLYPSFPELIISTTSQLLCIHTSVTPHVTLNLTLTKPYLINCSVSTHNSVTPRVAGILPTAWEEENEESPDAEQPYYSLPYTMFKWTIQFKNMIDLVREHCKYHYQSDIISSNMSPRLYSHIIDKSTNIPMIRSLHHLMCTLQSNSIMIVCSSLVFLQSTL